VSLSPLERSSESSLLLKSNFTLLFQTDFLAAY
jgi:hypothetical protein